MTTHRILPEALAELDEASTWYEEHDEGLGLDLLGEYRERLAFALKMPEAGALAGKTPGGAEIRRFRLKRFGRYAIVMARIDDRPTSLPSSIRAAAPATGASASVRRPPATR